MVTPIRPTDDDRRKLTAFSQAYAGLLHDYELSEDQIDAAIEELRPVRMWFHAMTYGDAPWFRIQL